ncbi:hypothetical protein, partial [Mesorhizobium sp.]|uniref:hypothetical protein n=1 Tax=Mesorhizobium sp. TaxID=1871066 RepID=UPI0025797236
WRVGIQVTRNDSDYVWVRNPALDTHLPRESLQDVCKERGIQRLILRESLSGVLIPQIVDDQIYVAKSAKPD